MSTSMKEHALEIIDVKKSFFQNPVLLGVSFEVDKGQILGLLGSNGAGKSTLMKIVNGVYKMDSGTIRVNGETVEVKNAADATANGIAMVFQEFSLVPTMTVVQNLFLGREPTKNGFIDEQKCMQETKAIFEEIGINIDMNAAIENLSVGEQQLVEICKGLMQNPAVLILDEPTASLSSSEVDILFEFLRGLK